MIHILHNGMGTTLFLYVIARDGKDYVQIIKDPYCSSETVDTSTLFYDHYPLYNFDVDHFDFLHILKSVLVDIPF